MSTETGENQVLSTRPDQLDSPPQQKRFHWVYAFEEGNADMRDLLGGKGAGLAEMSRAGLSVPPGFTITTEACKAYYAQDKLFPEGMWSECKAALKNTEAKAGKRFGDPSQPTASFRPLRRADFHARHDGHRAQPGP